MSLPSNKVCDKVSAQLFEGGDSVRGKLVNHTFAGPFSMVGKALHIISSWNSLQVHEGFEQLQMVKQVFNPLYASTFGIRNYAMKGKEVTQAMNDKSIMWTNLSKLVDTYPLMAFIIISIFSFIICISQAMHITLTSISEGRQYLPSRPFYQGYCFLPSLPSFVCPIVVADNHSTC